MPLFRVFHRTRTGVALSRRAGFALLALLVIMVSNGSSVQAQSTPQPTGTPPNQSSPASDGSTSDYLDNSLRLLFPAAPASLDMAGVEQPVFPSGTPSFDLFSLGTLSSLGGATPVTKTLSLELGGGVRGRIFANPPWLYPLPDRFINPAGNGRLLVTIGVRQDAGQGAGLLPGQTNWGSLKLALNGYLFEYSVPLVVGPPSSIGRDSGEAVFALQREIAARMDGQGDLDAFIGSPAYPNAGQVALGLAVDYLGEKEYNQRLKRADFVERVAETLARKDYNGDGWIGFRPEDILSGAPGWALGQKVK
ncbi:MAG TPA: hypothetical protein VH186_11590 [Chloroflexia bacterium]|nr:hypothetical protein [Chloroflexia bacterium]